MGAEESRIMKCEYCGEDIHLVQDSVNPQKGNGWYHTNYFEKPCYDKAGGCYAKPPREYYLKNAS